MTDKWLELAKELGGDKIKTEEGLFALRYDLREAYNHMIPLGEEYIEYNLEKGNYDKDPNCKNRLTINELEAIVKTSDFKYYSNKLFEYNKHFDYFNNDELNAVIDELFKRKLIEK